MNKNFENHKAEIICNEYNIIVIDFKEENTNYYWIRFYIDLNSSLLIINGDLGSAMACWYNKSSLEDIVNYVKDTQYFLKKIICTDDNPTQRVGLWQEALQLAFNQIKSFFIMEKINNLKGFGTESSPYLISSKTDLETFAKDVNDGNSYKGQFIKLTDNIKCDYDEDNQLTPIGNYDNTFQGTFNGNGKTISGLYSDNPNQYYVGLFGYNQGIIKNVGVVDSYFKGKEAVGGVCGYNNKGTITNCYNTGEVSGKTNIGGVCGENFKGTIKNCYNTGVVSGNNRVSGVCGYNNYDGTITNCYYLSNVDNGKDAKTKEQFNNGCVAYLLSKGGNGDVWGQDLSNPISLPTLYGSKVYYKYVNSDN